jgi:hypothetical protein
MTKLRRNRLIVVLGMHRSGTSAIARGLQVLGVDLGVQLIPPVDGNNAKGFWEDIHFNALDVEMLAAIESDWNYVGAIDTNDLEVLHRQGYFLRALELVQEKVSSSPIFAFKDPRVAKLLPFWTEVFAYGKFDVSYVLVVRHPLSVAKSLTKRDGLEAEQSYLLWLGHVLTSLSNSADKKRVLVDYDRLMQSPDHELSRIAKHLELEIDPKELQNYKTEFLDEELRHSFYDLNHLLLDDACPPLVQEVYSDLLDVASDSSVFSGLESKVARWLDEFERLKSTLKLIDKFLARIAESEGQVDLSHTIAERDRKIEEITNTISWKLTRPLRVLSRALSRLANKG